MLSPDETLDWIHGRISDIYRRPFVWVETASALDLILYYYHELMAEIAGEAKELRLLLDEAYRQECCGSAGFAAAFQLGHPMAQEREVAAYCIEQWMHVTDRLVKTIRKTSRSSTDI